MASHLKDRDLCISMKLPNWISFGLSSCTSKSVWLNVIRLLLTNKYAQTFKAVEGLWGTVELLNVSTWSWALRVVFLKDRIGCKQRLLV